MQWRITCFVCLVLFCCACSHLAVNQSAGQGATPGELAALENLPDISCLPVPQRLAGQVGPGFIILDPQQPLLANGTQNDGTALIIDGDASINKLPAYAIYGVKGFEPGTGPTSARVGLSAVNTKFFIGFADYGSGHWRFIGPLIQSTTVEIPAAGTPDPADYLSPEGYAYFGVFVAAGHNVRLALPELGIQGGSDAPAPVLEGQYTGDAWPYIASWTHSIDYQALDFDGYYIERAPLASGGFKRLNSTPVKSNYFIDDTVEVGEDYRIRIAAIDVSGNQSAWFEMTGPDGAAVLPVCILDAPFGPLDAPAEVMFDLSASFDPLGEALTEYRIHLGGGVDDIVSASPTITATLQPGCYIIDASVATGDGRRGHDKQALKVYPRWQASYVVVRDTMTPAGQCWSYPAAYYEEDTDALVVCALDARYPGVSLWRRGSSGVLGSGVLQGYNWARQLDPLSTYYPVSPVKRQQFLLFNNDSQLGFASMPGMNQARYDGIAAPHNPHAVFGLFADASNELLAVKLGRIDGSYPMDFVVAPVADLEAETLLCDGFDSSHFATVHQAPSGTVQIYCGSMTSALEAHTYWVSFDPATQAVLAEPMPANEWYPGAKLTDTETIGGTGSFMAYHDGSHVMSREYTGGAWQAPVAVDDTADNADSFDLAICGSQMCMLLSTDRPRRYRWTGSTWEVQNELSWETQPAAFAALARESGGDVDPAAVTISPSGTLSVGKLLAGGTDELLFQADPSSGAGPGLSAAADTNGIHVLARSIPDNTTYHYYSTSNGNSFIKLANLAAYDYVDLTSTTAGKVHLAAHQASSALLLHWNGSSFSGAASVSQSAFPLLSPVPEESVRWAAYTTSPDNHLEVVYGNPSGGYVHTQQTTAVQPVLTGIAGPSALTPYLFMLGLTDTALGQFTFAGLMNLTDGVETKLYTPQLPADFSLVQASMQYGPVAAAGYFMRDLGQGAGQAFWCAVGDSAAPVRMDIDASGTAATGMLPGAWDSSLTGAPVRLVQAAQADGDTAVCIAADQFGQEAVMEWSAFGAWEQLEMPAAVRGMASYELCVDRNGRWHLLAHDWQHDRIICLNSL